MADPDELLDVITPTGQPVGLPQPRSTVHAEGLWHQTFHCLVVRSDPPARVVLQRRSPTARAFANKLDLSATGHLQSGESPVEGLRELREELGIDPSPDDLIPLGVRLLADDSGEGQNRERTHVYLLVDDRPLDHFRPDPVDVTSLVEAGVDDLLALAANRSAVADAREWRPGTGPVPVGITNDDLIHPVDYFVLVLIMAERLVNGLGPLAI